MHENIIADGLSIFGTQYTYFSGPVLNAHGSLDLQSENQIQIQIQTPTLSLSTERACGVSELGMVIVLL
jgi:hypothetical protein